MSSSNDFNAVRAHLKKQQVYVRKSKCDQVLESSVIPELPQKRDKKQNRSSCIAAIPQMPHPDKVLPSRAKLFENDDEEREIEEEEDGGGGNGTTTFLVFLILLQVESLSSCAKFDL